jgi:transcriptional regulator of arginine metabolism
MTETEVRRSAIRALVDRYPVSSQEDLVDLLRTEHAISASQPTVSRDLEVLGIRRVGRSYRLPEIDGLRQRLRAFALEIASSGNLAVIRTPPGGGPTVAAAIDAAAPQGVLATVQGDDTVLVVACEDSSGREVADLLTQMKERT